MHFALSTTDSGSDRNGEEKVQDWKSGSVSLSIMKTRSMEAGLFRRFAVRNESLWAINEKVKLFTTRVNYIIQTIIFYYITQKIDSVYSV